MTDITVVVADDHPVYRGGLRAALADVPGVVVVAEAATGADAVTAAIEHQADVVLMDLAMPGGTGIEAIIELRRRRPETAVLALTMHDDPVTVAAAVAAGARGYLVKGAGQDDIVRAIRTVAAGDLLLAGPVADHLLAGLNTPAAVGHRHDGMFPELTVREREILDLVARGSSNHEIARQLFLADKTVRNHVSNVLTKLGCATRAEAVARARDAGLGTPD